MDVEFEQDCGDELAGSSAPPEPTAEESDQDRGGDSDNSDDSDIEASVDSDHKDTTMLGGPTTYEVSLYSIRWLVDNFVNDMGKPLTQEALSEFLDHGIVLTTDYSGCGTAELAAAMIQEAFVHQKLATAEAARGLVVHSRACDRDGTCRETLRSHPSTSLPKHVMEDILDRLPDLDQQKVSNWQKAHTDKFHAKHELSKTMPHSFPQKPLHSHSF